MTLSKILALYHNEMIKFSHQLLVWALIAIMSVVTILASTFYVKMNGEEEFVMDQVDKSSITASYDSAKEQLGDPNRFVKHSTIRIQTSSDVIELFSTYYDFGEDEEEATKNLYNYLNMSICSAMLVNYDFDKYPITQTALSQNAYAEYTLAFRSLIYHNMTPFGERDSAWYDEYCLINQELEFARSALFNHNYKDYVEAIKLHYSAYPITDTLDIQIQSRIAEVDVNGEMSVSETLHLNEILVNYFIAKDCLLKGAEFSGGSYTPLTESRRADLEDAVQILDYQLAHHSYASYENSNASQSVMFGISLGRLFLIVLAIIIAGSSISNELATGSIKSLIIAPVKRWKIFVAKLLAILTWILGGGFLITLLSTICVGCTQGFSSLLPYFYVSGGSVKSIPFLLFAFLYFLASSIEMLVYVLVAFVISCNSKNAGAACGISTALIMSGEIINLFLDGYGRRTWMDFLPYYNMDITTKVFSHLPLCGQQTLDSGLLSESSPIGLSLGFSTIYLIILTITLLWIAYDGFVRKDIQ